MLLYCYYMLMVTCFTISIFFYKLSMSVRMISQLLFISILTEIAVELCKVFEFKYYLLYHIFTPIEYTYIALYFYYTVANVSFKRYSLFSILIFVLVCFVEIILNNNLENFPRFLSYMECFLVIILSITSLLFLEVDLLKPIYKVSDFWFAIAFLFFNSALFVVLFFNQEEDREVRRIFSIINQLANCFLYSLLSIGFLCLKKKI